MKDMLSNKYRVYSGCNTDYKTSHFAYSYTPALKHRFVSVCNNIIDEIALRGHVAICERVMFFDSGVCIEERTESGRLIRLFSVFIAE